MRLRPPTLNATELLFLSPPARHLKIDPRHGSDVISSTGEWSSTVETPHPVGFLFSFFFPAAQSRLCTFSCLGNPSAIKRGSIHFYDFRIFLHVGLQVCVCACECRQVLDLLCLFADKYFVL